MIGPFQPDLWAVVRYKPSGQPDLLYVYGEESSARILAQWQTLYDGEAPGTLKVMPIPQYKQERAAYRAAKKLGWTK